MGDLPLGCVGLGTCNVYYEDKDVYIRDWLGWGCDD